MCFFKLKPDRVVEMYIMKEKLGDNVPRGTFKEKFRKK